MGPNDRRFAMIEFCKDLLVQGNRVLLVYHKPIDRSQIFTRIQEELENDGHDIRKVDGLLINEIGRFSSARKRTTNHVMYEDWRWDYVLTHPSMFNYPVPEGYNRGMYELVERSLSRNESSLILVRDAKKVLYVLNKLLKRLGSVYKLEGDRLVNRVAGTGIARVIEYPESKFKHKGNVWSYVISDHSLWRDLLRNS